LDTAVVGIGGESRRTEFAQSLVVLHHTGCVPGTHSGGTRVLTLVLDTSLSTGTPLIPEADGSRGVAAGGTDTDGLMVQHLAFLSNTTPVSVAAWVLASPVITGLVGRAVVVDPTLHLSVWTGELSLLIDNQAVLAGAFRFMV